MSTGGLEALHPGRDKVPEGRVATWALGPGQGPSCISCAVPLDSWSPKNTPLLPRSLHRPAAARPGPWLCHPPRPRLRPFWELAAAWAALGNWASLAWGLTVAARRVQPCVTLAWPRGSKDRVRPPRTRLVHSPCLFTYCTVHARRGWGCSSCAPGGDLEAGVSATPVVHPLRTFAGVAASRLDPRLCPCLAQETWHLQLYVCLLQVATHIFCLVFPGGH